MSEQWLIFWALIFACSTGVLGSTAILLERERRREREGRLAWKAAYHQELRASADSETSGR